MIQKFEVRAKRRYKRTKWKNRGDEIHYQFDSDWVGVMIGLFCVILAILGLPYFIQIFKRNERIAADIAYRYRDGAEIQANAIDRVEIQAMIEKALKEQAQVQKVG